MADKDPFGLYALWHAYRACRKGKRATRDTQRYEARLLDRLVSSRDALARFAWRPSRTLAFVVSSPKLREIHAAPFADRVVHHLLTDRLARIYEPVFIHDTYANRVGKGTHAAVDRLQAFMRQAEGGHVATEIAAEAAPTPMCPAEGFVGAASAAIPLQAIAAEAAPTKLAAPGVYALQLDIANFFNSIHRPTLFGLLQQRLVRAVRRQGLGREEARALQAHCRALLQADPTKDVRRKGPPGLFDQVPPHKRLGALGPGVGLPIGNLTSQFFANVYLNELDQFVKHTLKARWYVRYVDDFVLLHHDPAQLLAWRDEIERFLSERLRLKLKARAEPKPLAAGVDFLGYVIRPHYKLVRRRAVRHFHARLVEFERRHVRPNALRLPPNARDLLRAQVASYLGHLRHAHGYRLWLDTLELFPWLHRIFDRPENAVGLPRVGAALAAKPDGMIAAKAAPTVGREPVVAREPVGGGLPPKGFIAAKAGPTVGREPVGGGLPPKGMLEAKAAPTVARESVGGGLPPKGSIAAKAPPALRPAWEPASVSGLAGQYRAFVRRYPAACVLMQVGKNWLAAGVQATPLFHQPGAVPMRRPGLENCLEFPAHRLAQVRRTLKRAAIPHILVAQTGAFKTAFKRRAMVLIWCPGPDPLNPFLSSSRRGPT